MNPQRDATQLLERAAGGDAAAANDLFELVYGDLHRAASSALAGERAGHTLQATALVNEAYVRLVEHSLVGIDGKNHFLRTAARAMRHVLIDHARARGREKRGGAAVRVEMDEFLAGTEKSADGLLALNDALEQLTALDAQLGQIVELRFFGGYTIEETANLLDISTATVERGWRTARAWLYKRFQET